MGENQYDIDAALKDYPEDVVAAEMAKIHGVDRDAYLKDGVTDAQFLQELKGNSAPASTSNLSEPSNTTNAVIGGAAAVAGAIPGGARAGISHLLSSNKPAPAAPVAQPARTFATPTDVSQRVTAAGQPPRPEGPTDVVNWAMGKDDRTGQYKRGYLGGTSQEHEAALHKQADALEAKNPGYKIKPGTTNLLIPEAEYNKIINEVKAAEKSAADALQNKAKMAAELRANRLSQINPANAPIGAKVAQAVGNVGAKPVTKNFLTGYNASDFMQAQNPFEASVSAVGAAAPYSAGLIEKALPPKYKPLAKLLGPVVGAAAPAVNWLERKLIGPQQEQAPEQHAAGGLAQNYAEGGHATPAWQRSEGKNPEGGLNAVGRASYNREHGGHLKAPQPEGGSRKDSFCARMEGMKKKRTSSKTANDPDSRINKSLRKWKC